MKTFLSELKRHLNHNLRTDPLSRKIYSVDASIYEVEPIAIAIPQSIEELLFILELAAKYEVSVTARGAATGITGSCLGKGLIIDISKYLNQILEINIEKEYALCEPGVVQDRLNEALKPYGYRLGPDTSTGNRATLGGMLANNSAGARSLYYGCMVDHVEQVELALAGGTRLTFGPINKEQLESKCRLNGIEGNIYRALKKLSFTYHDAIENSFPKIPRHVSGYNLDALLDFPLNISKLIAGSEGTLGIATKIKMKIAKVPPCSGLCLIHVSNMLSSLTHIEAMLAHRPMSLEMIDNKILEAGKQSPSVKNRLNWLLGMPEAVFIAEFEATDPSELQEKIASFISDMKKLDVGYAYSAIDSPEEMNDIWTVRKAGLGLLLSKRSYNRAIAFIEDVSVAPAQLPSFLEKLCHYLKKKNKEVGIYGHIGSGCMHIRPYIDLRKSEEVSLMKQIMLDVAQLVKEHSGAMSGEHGDGLIRSWLNPIFFGKEIAQAFIDLKAVFDPKNLMNPGKIVNGPPLEQDLRLDPNTTIQKIPTFLDFSAEGGFELAADLCNGNGECRKMENVMCPSFQATGDEYDTTRARAQSLRSIIHGKLPIQELQEQALIDVLDLCLECKGCKRECPSQVDMAKMKAEVLYQYQEKHGYFWRNRIFGHLHAINKISAPFAAVINPLLHSKLGKTVLDWIGISPNRDLPTLSHERFSNWFATQQHHPKEKKIVLFNDTYTEFHQPGVGKAAFQLLSQLGYELILFSNHCCGRPLISKGMLKQAKKMASALITNLSKIAHNLPIIVLEPSCASAIRDDFTGVLGHNHPEASLLAQIQSNCYTLEEFLLTLLNNGQLPLKFKESSQNIAIHGHCHQKALVGNQPTLTILKSIPGVHVEEIQSGCCGLAGSFGYEKEHDEISMQIGELKLFPAIRKEPSNTVIVASGFSCRSQIEHGTERKAVHLAQALLSTVDGVDMNKPPKQSTTI